MSVHGHAVALALGLSVLRASAAVAGPDQLELGLGTTPSGGEKLAVGFLHDVSSAVALTANTEWSQRPWTRGESTRSDRRLAYFGGGARLRLFPAQRVGTFATVGIGLGRLSFPGGSEAAEWHAVPWTGLGTELRVGRRLYLGAEARVEWVRRLGSVDGELPLRVTLRVPLGRKGSLLHSRNTGRRATGGS